MYALKIQLVIVEFLEALSQHLPQPIASWLERLADRWRDKIALDMLEQIERMKREVYFLRKQASEIQSITRKMKDSPRSDKDDSG